MKSVLIIAFVLLPILLLAGGDKNNCCEKNSKGRCTGSAVCTVCSNCSACKYCVDGKTCGVCAARKSYGQRFKSASPQAAPSSIIHRAVYKSKKKPFSK